ncbi:hypothetical protein PQQ87_08980 [Paraburkholderia nemoris]|uniref:hypothetical protein n=1 Tax=Paraburkholderia nemoris TaxID=2793076 RepID=UPI0038B84C45
MKKAIAPIVGTAIVFYMLGAFTPQWAALYRHRQDIRSIAADCNKAASEVTLKPGEDSTHVFRECFNNLHTALIEQAERHGALQAGDLARKLD